MKSLIVFLLFFVVVNNKVRAQEIFLGDTRAHIKEIMQSKDQVAFLASSFTNDKKIEFDVFLISKSHSVSFYYTAGIDTCNHIYEAYDDIKMIFAAISDLNNRLVRVDDNTWIDKKNRIKVILSIEKNSFGIDYMLI